MKKILKDKKFLRKPRFPVSLDDFEYEALLQTLKLNGMCGSVFIRECIYAQIGDLIAELKDDYKNS
jgi:hypothetical protein